MILSWAYCLNRARWVLNGGKLGDQLLYQLSIDCQSPILANLIIDEIKEHKQELLRIIESHLTSDTKSMLDELFEKEDNQSSKVQRYKLTLLKKLFL
jgi:hypothetical protein